MNGRPWTKEEEQALLDNQYLDADIIARKLKRSRQSVISKLQKLTPVDSSRDRSLTPLPEPLTKQQKIERIYHMAHKLGVKII